MWIVTYLKTCLNTEVVFGSQEFNYIMQELDLCT